MAAPMLLTRHDAALLPAEASRLADCEARIERGLHTFVEVGLALMEVRDARLYRAAFPTFEEYCRERWSMSKTQANRLVSGAEAVGNLTPIGVIPATESQARPLTRLEPDQQREAWQLAVETAPTNGNGITAAHVESAVREVEGRPRMAVHYTSDSPEWYTPARVLDVVVAVLGTIDLDPCSNTGKPNVPAKRHLDAEDDGLAQAWKGRVYMNPPYGDDIGEWTRKLTEEFEAGRVTEAVALLPARTDTKWFAALQAYPVCFVDGRLKFSGADGSAPFPSALVYFGKRPAAFRDALASIGRTYVALK